VDRSLDDVGAALSDPAGSGRESVHRDFADRPPNSEILSALDAIRVTLRSIRSSAA